MSKKPEGLGGLGEEFCKKEKIIRNPLKREAVLISRGLKVSVKLMVIEVQRTCWPDSASLSLVLKLLRWTHRAGNVIPAPSYGPQ